jgi:hypothetical protein
MILDKRHLSAKYLRINSAFAPIHRSILAAGSLSDVGRALARRLRTNGVVNHALHDWSE